MNTDQNQNILEKNLSDKIIGCAFKVYNVLGYGFLEKVYENSLAQELKANGILVEQQFAIAVYYNSQNVGEYKADLWVEKKIIIELKAEKYLNTQHLSQLLNYLKATNINLGYLVNFGIEKVEFKRLIL